MLSSTFHFDGQDFATLTDDEGVHWIHAGDVCRYLEVKNPSQTIQRHVFPDWRKQIAVGPGQPAWFINEPGFYLLTGKVSSPKAEKAQRWFYGVVLPKLRAEGGYIRPDATQQQKEALISKLTADLELAEKKAKLYCDLQGVTLKAFHASLKQAIGPKFKAKVDHFCNVTVDYLIDASVQPWQIDMGGNKLSDYHYPLDAMIVASRQYLTAFERKAVRAFDEHFGETLDIVAETPVSPRKSMLPPLA